MYKALISFSGIISMTADEVKEITDKEIVKDLLEAGYIEEIKKETKATKETKETKNKKK